jgi:hypothetical protein
MNGKIFGLLSLLACASSQTPAQVAPEDEAARPEAQTPVDDGSADPAPKAQAGPDVEAEAEAALDIASIRMATAPLVALPLDLDQASDPIWVRGDRPEANLIATVNLRPVGGVVVEQDLGQGERPLILWRAVTGPVDSLLTPAALVEAGGERLYCADGVGPQVGSILCLVDGDGDGRFEATARGLGEHVPRVADLSLVGPSVPLPEPVPYRTAQPDELPLLVAEYRNCARDHDRPRYYMRLRPEFPIVKPNEAPPATPEGLRNDPDLARRVLETVALIRTGGFGCEPAERVRSGESLYPGDLERGAVAARLAELVIAVGPRDSGAAVRLVGLRSLDRLYRARGMAVMPVSARPTDRQQQLSLAQRFNRPVLMLAAAPDVREGARTVGDVLFEVPVRHGYTGVLTQDTVIRTLLARRSLPAGTALYGIPMSTRMVTTVNGVPRGDFGGQGGGGETHLVWCTPVEDEGRWTATCLPTQPGRYTILRGQRPAFEVRRFSYDAGTSTNDGPVPVVEREADFGRPLRYRFRLDAVEADRIVVTRETLFGEEVVDRQPIQIARHRGETGGIMLAGGAVALAASADGGVEVRQVRDFQVGGDVLNVEAGRVEDDPVQEETPPAAKPVEDPDPA